MPREKIVILGGGPSALTTAYWLTSTPELRAKYDITVYQMGWRLGGKGRSGRNLKDGRIEEHGLHILFGFYQNFFTMIRNVYDELGRPPTHPLATWREAFHPHDFGAVEHFYKGQWHSWWLQFPANPAIPGQGGEALNGSRDYLLMLLQTSLTFLFGPRAERWFENIIFPRGERWNVAPDVVPSFSGRPDAGVRLAIRLMGTTLALAGRIESLIDLLPALNKILRRLRALTWKAMHGLTQVNNDLFRFWIGVDFFVAVLLGFIEDRIFEPGGFARLDQYDFREWIRMHGGHEQTLQSPYVRTVYDAAFSYAGGDPKKQSCSASAALRALLRMGCTYKGAVYYKMMSGMGDTVFGPLYLVLKKRGVHFKFFHKVEELTLSSDGNSIASVRINQQAKLKAGIKEYDPFWTIKGLECWPAEPLYDQLKDADELRKVDLESYYSRWKGYGDVLLQAGRDFDKVVLATPVGCLPFLCKEILEGNEEFEGNERWRQMVERVQAVQTVSLQVWFRKNLKELGWDMPAPLLSLFVEPLNTWADMSQTLATEDWSDSDGPKNVAYFTGAQPGPVHAPPATDHEFPDRMKADARRVAMEFMKQNITTLLKNAVDPAVPPEVDWDLLHASADLKGEARFEDQYYRSNCDPAERCTVALPGATRYRMKAGETGYSNLVVAGDWIDNGLYVACMEGAIQGGIYGARAVAGERFPIIGEDLLPDQEILPVPKGAQAHRKLRKAG